MSAFYSAGKHYPYLPRLLYKHPWNDSPEPSQSLLRGCAESQETYGVLSSVQGNIGLGFVLWNKVFQNKQAAQWDRNNFCLI